MQVFQQGSSNSVGQSTVTRSTATAVPLRFVDSSRKQVSSGAMRILWPVVLRGFCAFILTTEGGPGVVGTGRDTSEWRRLRGMGDETTPR